MIFFFSSPETFAQESNHLKENLLNGEDTKVLTDLIYVKDKKIFQDLFLISDSNILINMSLACYKYEKEDSFLIYSIQRQGIDIKKGLNRKHFHLGDVEQKVFIHPVFSAILKRFSIIPSGGYKIHLNISSNDLIIQRTFIHNIDSILSPYSELQVSLDENILKWNYNSKKSKKNQDQYFSRKIDFFFKSRSLNIQKMPQEGSLKINLFYKDWFVGQTQFKQNAPSSFKEHKSIKSFEPLISKEIENQQTLITQFRDINQTKKEEEEIKLHLNLSSNFSNGQEAFSQQENSSYDIEGSIELPVFGIPIAIDGYLTTEDKNREAKARYIHFSYDVDKSKEKLMKLIASYNNKYEEMQAQKNNYKMIFGKFIYDLKNEENTLMNELKNEVEISDNKELSFKKRDILEGIEMSPNKLANKIKNDSLPIERNLDKITDSLRKKKEEIATKYRKLTEIQAKIKKYENLINQYKNASYFDSILAYDKIRDLSNIEQISYKDIAKKTSALLPDGKASSFMTGLISLDAGKFSKSLSTYTIAGQTLNGLSLEYDIGFAKTGLSYGKTEYIDGYGRVESYKSYSGSVSFKPIFHQNIGIVYYGYSPSSDLLKSDNFFKSSAVSLPSFRNPVHILSLLYQGDLSNHLKLNGEYAFSTQQGQSKEAVKESRFIDKSVFNIGLLGEIPKTTINIEAAFEFSGNDFKNNTLPIIMTGTQKLKLKSEGTFFKSFLTLAAEYNYLIQNKFSSKGKNTRWGFEVKTHSKRYPSFALSYKPFSVFRTYDDTLSVEQKPILGEVWTGRANYQFKKLDNTLRFFLIYNENTSFTDSFNYKSVTFQGGCIYLKKAFMLSLNVGFMQINSDQMEQTYVAFNNNQFLTLNGSLPLLKELNIFAGADLTRTSQGIGKYGGSFGTMYSFRKKPVVLRGNFRYNKIRKDIMNWTPIMSAHIDLIWNLSMKLK